MGVAHLPPCNTVTFEPLSAVMLTTVSAQFEREVMPRVGLSALAGIGSTTDVAIGDRIHHYSTGSSEDTLEDVHFKRVHIGVGASYYSDQFRGAHLAGELVYLHHGWSQPELENIDTVSASAYGGYKWVWAPGLTVVVQGGLGLVGTNAGLMTGWHLDRDGTLGPVHLAANASVGWTF
jgi:hypothetical protein